MNDLTEDDLREFNEKPVNDDEQGSLKGSDDEDNIDNVDFNEQIMQDPQLCKGMKFTSGEVFRIALQEWAIKRGYSYILNKNNKERVSAICKDKCGFQIHASRLRDCNTFQIKTFKPVHSCLRE